MTLFEYLATGHTLIVSFAIARVFAGVPHALRPGRRYWVHVSWLSLAVAFCLISFWGFWSYRELDVEWTIFRFVGAFASSVLIYVYSSLVVPPTLLPLNPGETTSSKCAFPCSPLAF